MGRLNYYPKDTVGNAAPEGTRKSPADPQGVVDVLNTAWLGTPRQITSHPIRWRDT